MSLFAVWARDRPGTGGARLRVRDAHRARLRAPAPHAVRVVLAGPLLEAAGADGEAMSGTLLVVEAADEAAVRAFVRDDPYVIAGVYGDVDVRRWRLGLGPPEWLDPV